MASGALGERGQAWRGMNGNNSKPMRRSATLRTWRSMESGDGPLPFWLSGQGPTPAHSGYFDVDRNPSAADNLALIVAGHSDLITEEAPR